MALLNYQPPLSPYLQIVHQDDHLLLLNKPSGLLSVPGKAPAHKDSLQKRVQRVFPTATVVHRLDMATSGLMVMALNKASHRHLSRQFELRQTRKHYLARVDGHVVAEQGSIALPLICDWPNRPKQMVALHRGKTALTHWRVLQRQANSSLLQLTPVTGRSHQLRVHMLALGHVILGDRLYAHPQALAAASRLQLHAAYLAFEHPDSGQWMEFRCAADFS